MRSNPDLDALVRRAEEAGGKVLRTRLPDEHAGPVASDFRCMTEIRSEAPGLAPGRHEFTIAGFRPPSLNRLMRGKIKDRIRLSREARDRIALAARLACVGRADGVKRRVSLEITLAGRQRPLDVDAVWKAILDGMTHSGLIVDDSCRWCALGEVWFLRGETTSTKIILEDVGEDSPR